MSMLVTAEEKPPAPEQLALRPVLQPQDAALCVKQDTGIVSQVRAVDASVEAPEAALRVPLPDAPEMRSKLKYERLQYQAFHYSDEAG